mmetsp:Transcript_3687/g.6262  ORF Transcript_3687/g.6262 Transcript_3687/m.6262 type:complete len:196 (-) Transcript_3687:138-725(-)
MVRNVLSATANTCGESDVDDNDDDSSSKLVSCCTLPFFDDDDDDDDGKAMTFSVAMQRLQDGIIQRIEPSVQCAPENITFRDVLYPAYKSLGLLMVSFGGRVLIKGYTTPQDAESQSLNRAQIGAIIVAVNEWVIPQNAAFSKVLEYMRMLIMYGPLTLLFAEDKEFMPWFKEVMIPRFDAQLKARALAQASRTG